jgi:hypothetical protein
MHTNNVQYPFAEQVGVSFASLGEVNHRLCDGFVDVGVGVRPAGSPASLPAGWFIVGKMTLDGEGPLYYGYYEELYKDGSVDATIKAGNCSERK